MTARTRRVLHLTRDLPPRHAGGISTAVGGLLGAATGLDGGPVHAVISFDGWRPNRNSSPMVQPPLCDLLAAPLPTIRAEGPADLAAATAFAAAFGPDVVHIHHALLFDLVPQLFPMGPPTVLLTLHVLQFHLSSLRGLDAPTRSDDAETRALAAAHAISVPTQAARELLIAASPHLAPRVFVTPLGIADGPARTPGNDCTHNRIGGVDLTTDRTTPTLVYIGRFDALKGLPELCSAVPTILKARPDTRIIIAGGLPENPKADRRWARRLALLRADGVTILPWLSPEEVARLLRRATHFVAPSHAETCGLTLMEARAAGLHLIASELGAHREVAPDADFFPPGDVQGLATAVVAALDQSSCREPREPSAPRWREVLPDWVHFWAK